MVQRPGRKKSTKDKRTVKRKYSGEILTDFNIKDSLWRERYYSLLELNTCIKIGKIKCENIVID